MIAKVLKKEKNHVEIELENLTIAELLRNFLLEDKNVKVAAWKREHPSKNPVLIIITDGETPKKALGDAISRIEKLNSKILEELKKIKK